MRNRLAIAAVLVLASNLACRAAKPEERIRRVEQGLIPVEAAKGQATVRASIAERMKELKVPGAGIAVVANGGIEWARGYGQASAGSAASVTPGTLFQAASISKPVAAMVALRLVELDRLSLDEDVNLKLRSWKVPETDLTGAEKVTLRRLLSHTAGLAVHGFRGYAAGEEVPTLRQLLDGAVPANSAPIRPNALPGSLWRYSGGGYEVMQQLIEDVTGKPFPQVARDLVLEPLSMRDSTFEQPLPESYAGRAAAGHLADGRALDGRWHTYPELAAAGLWTTPSDLARVILEIQNPGRVLQRDTVEEMLTLVLGNYGLGFQVGGAEGGRFFSHGGSNAGFQCMLFAYRDCGWGAVVMTNGDRGAALALEILAAIAVEYDWENCAAASQFPPPSAR